jgi:hypothetical protein
MRLVWIVEGECYSSGDTLRTVLQSPRKESRRKKRRSSQHKKHRRDLV